LNKNSKQYRNIISVTSLFGGLQVLLILIGAIKGKIIAIYIGAEGMGQLTLFTSILEIVNLVCTLGFGYSATRLVSKAHEANSYYEIRKILSIVSKILLFSSFAGIALLILFSKKISFIFFGNDSLFMSIIFLSITVFFTVFLNRNNLFLQSFGEFKNLAKSNLIGAFFGLIASFIFYFYYGLNGIVPSIIFTSISIFLSSTFFFKKLKLKKIKISLNNAISEGGPMIKLGLVMVLASIVGSLVKNLVNIFITNYGDISDLGFYNAGHTIALSYVGMIFTAMSYEYFPRLSRISEDNNKVREAVNQQSEIIFLILLPILAVLICFTELIINVFLTSEFYVIIKFIRILSFSILINAAAFTISYIPIVKGDKKIFFSYNSLIPGISALLLFSAGYYFGNLTGLAIGICLVSIIHFSFMFIVCKKLYEFKVSKNFISFFVVNLITISTAFTITNFESNLKYLNVFVLIFAFCFFLYNINKLVDLKEIINDLLIKFKK
jgi:O-antigen/teichoic acid export membrane protein